MSEPDQDMDVTQGHVVGICMRIEQVIRVGNKRLKLQSDLGVYGKLRRETSKDYTFGVWV